MAKQKTALALNYDAAKQKGAGIENLEFVLTPDEAKDGKEHRAGFVKVSVANREQATALFNGDDKALWTAVSDYVTTRNKRNAVTTCYAEAKGPEGRVATSVLTLLDTGLPNAEAVAVQTAMTMLELDDAGARAFIAKVKAQREAAAKKRAADAANKKKPA